MNKKVKSVGKTILRFTISAAVGTVVTNIIRNNTPAGVNTMTKALITLGDLILSGMFADQAVDYAEKEIAEITNPENWKPVEPEEVKKEE